MNWPKARLGLDHYAVRRWDSWYRHMTLAMFALAFLAYLVVLRAYLRAGGGGVNRHAASRHPTTNDAQEARPR